MTSAQLGCEAPHCLISVPLLPLQPGGRVSCMAVRAAGASGSYTFGSEEGRKIRLGAPHALAFRRRVLACPVAGSPLRRSCLRVGSGRVFGGADVRMWC